MVVIGFIIAFILAFGIGANDVANSFGTSVGAKVLTLKSACILASIFETTGAILIGSKVSDTIRKGIIDIEPYVDTVNDTGRILLMKGNVAALGGSAIWLFAATFLKMPVSATHSIVGATVGFALVTHGGRGVNWLKMAMIVGSWFVSPVLAGFVSTAFFFFCKHFILNKENPLEPGLKFLPLFYAITIAINFFSIFYDGPEMLYLDRIPIWGAVIVAIGAAIFAALIVRLALVPWQRRNITAKCLAASLEKSENGALKQDDVKIPMLDNYNGNAKSLENDKEQRRRHRTNSGCLNNPVANVMPPNAASKIMTNITHPNDSTTPTKTAPIIRKSETNSLMQNEYKLGSSDPVYKMNGCKTAEVAIIMPNGDTIKKVPIEIVPSINNNYNKQAESEEDEQLGGRSLIKDRPETGHLFSYLQILTAIFGSFAHGGNDVSNAIGPLVSLWLLSTTMAVSAKASTPIWILLFGGAGISLGLWVLGSKVIKTIGEDLATTTPSSGFCIEIGSALTVLIASNVGIPISTTHCKIGSIVCVGRFRSRENVDWKTFKNIILAWIVTLPVTMGISAGLMAVFLQI